METPVCSALTMFHHKLFFFKGSIRNITVWLAAVLRSEVEVLFSWKLPSLDNCRMLCPSPLLPALNPRPSSLCQSDPQAQSLQARVGCSFPTKWIKSNTSKSVGCEKTQFLSIISLLSMNKSCFPRFIPSTNPLPAHHHMLQTHQSGHWIHGEHGGIFTQRR